MSGNPVFPTTHWSLIQAATDPQSPQYLPAREEFFGAYWYPLYVFARREGKGPEDAKDLVQGFFLDLLSKNWFRQADPNQGRLRSFLLACFRCFQSNEWRKEHAAKRGQGRTESLEAVLENAEDRYRSEPRDESDPARLYDQAWILGLVDRALERLAQEYEQGEGADRFAVLKQFLPGRPRSMTQIEAGARLGMNGNAVNQAVHKLRVRLGEILREDIARTCLSPGDFTEEVRFILAHWSP